MPSEPSQLRMGFRRLADLQPPEPVPGYSLRTLLPGDEDAWIGVLNAGDFGHWDRARLDRLVRDGRYTEVVRRKLSAHEEGRLSGS